MLLLIIIFLWSILINYVKIKPKSFILLLFGFLLGMISKVSNSENIYTSSIDYW